MFQTTNQKQIEATNDFYRTMLLPPVTAMWQSRFVRWKIDSRCLPKTQQLALWINLANLDHVKKNNT